MVVDAFMNTLAMRGITTWNLFCAGHVAPTGNVVRPIKLGVVAYAVYLSVGGMNGHNSE